jgi:hypothetical protein
VRRRKKRLCGEHGVDATTTATLHVFDHLFGVVDEGRIDSAAAV